LILGPSVVQAAQRSSQGRYGLLRESGGERFGRQHLGFLQTDTDRRQARVLAWNETATSRADRAYGRLDARGLRKMADEARRMGAEARKSGDELAETAPKYDKFARDAEAAAKRVQWANRLFGKGKVGADDVVDRLAAVRVKERFERMRQDGIRSIGGMRARMTRDMRLIEQGFTAGSRGASEAMRRHFDIGIDSMSDAMRRGRVDAGRGAREIAQVTRRQMEAMSSGVMDNSRESRAALADDFGDGIKAVRRAMRDGKMSTDEGMTAIRRITRQQMQATKARLTDDSAAGRAALATNMLRAADAVRTQMRRAGRETKEGTRLIRRYMVDALQDMGLSARSTRNILKGGNDDREFGDKDRNLGREGGAPINYDRAHGGWIGRAGLRGHDRIMVRAGLGEYVANGDDQAVIEPSLALAAAAGLHSYPSLEALDAARARKRPHAATGSGPSPLLAMARGGRVSLMGADPDLAGYARLSGRFGLRVSSGLRPGSITSSGNRSHHGTGDALDLAGAPAAMLRFARHIASRFGRRLEELIYTPLGWSIKNGRRVPAYAQADHYDHVHIADTDASGVAGGASMIPRIRRVRVSGLHGQVRVLAQGAVDRVRAGAQRRVNRAAQRMMDAGAVGGPGAGGAGSIPMGRLRGLIAQALRFTGHWAPTPANVNAVLGRVMQESGGNPNALNDWDINARRGDPSIGLLQTIGATFARYRDRRLPNNIRHPLANLVAGLNYMKAVYGRIVASNGRGYERGGVVGRFLRRATGRGLAGTRTVRGGGLLARNVRTGAPRRFPRGATVPAEVARVYGITARQARRHRITIQGRLSPRELLGERAQDREAFARRTEQIQSELALRERRFALDEEDLADPDELAEALQEGRGLIRPLRRQAQLQEQVVESYDDTLDDLQDQYRAERRRAGRSYEQRRAEFGLSRTERRREIRGEDRQQKRLRRRLDDPDVTGRRRERMTDRLRESRAREQRLERIRKADEGQRRRMQRTLTEEHRKAQRRRAEQHRRRQRGVRGERRDAAGQLAETRLSIREQQAELAEQTGPAAVLASQLEMIDLRERAGRISEAQAAAERAFARQVALTRPMSERDRLAVEADMRAETGPLARVAGAMEQIDLHLRAGSFGTDAGAEQRANQWRQGVIAQTLAAGGLTDREALELRAQLREATEAIEQAQRAQEEHTAALKSVSEEMKRNNDIAQGVMATTGREAVRALADVLSGQLGAMTTSRAPTPGYGTSWRF
jgi:SLT domain-containing protein